MAMPNIGNARNAIGDIKMYREALDVLVVIPSSPQSVEKRL